MQKIAASEYVKPSIYVKFPEGDSRIRIVSEIYLYKKYGTKVAGRFIAQIVRDGEPVNEVFLRSKGESSIPKRKYGFIAFSFAAKEFRIIECGPILGDMISQLLKANANYKESDLIIHRTGLQLRDTKYTVSFAKDESEKLPEKTPAMIAQYNYCVEYFEQPKRVEA